MPNPTTTIQWNLAHGNLSMRAGTRLRCDFRPLELAVVDVDTGSS
jgi:hypothetical protein